MPTRAEQFQILVSRQPQNELFHFSLAQALANEGRAAEAVPHFEFCVAAKQDWMVPRIQLGKILLDLGRKAEARLVLTEALDLAVKQHHEEPEQEVRALLATP